MADMAAFYKLLLVRAPKLLANRLEKFVFAAGGMYFHDSLQLSVKNFATASSRGGGRGVKRRKGHSQAAKTGPKLNWHILDN